MPSNHACQPTSDNGFHWKMMGSAEGQSLVEGPFRSYGNSADPVVTCKLDCRTVPAIDGVIRFNEGWVLRLDHTQLLEPGDHYSVSANQLHGI
jgi:hypothetical protein